MGQKCLCQLAGGHLSPPAHVDDLERMQTARCTAERAVAEAEAAVSEWDGRVAELRAALEDAHLYLTADGGRRAAGVGGEMETARSRLDEAFAGWEAATRAAEAAG